MWYLYMYRCEDVKRLTDPHQEKNPSLRCLDSLLLGTCCKLRKAGSFLRLWLVRQQLFRTKWGLIVKTSNFFATFVCKNFCVWKRLYSNISSSYLHICTYHLHILLIYRSTHITSSHLFIFTSFHLHIQLFSHPSSSLSLSLSLSLLRTRLILHLSLMVVDLHTYTSHYTPLPSPAIRHLVWFVFRVRAGRGVENE